LGIGVHKMSVFRRVGDRFGKGDVALAWERLSLSHGGRGKLALTGGKGRAGVEGV